MKKTNLFIIAFFLLVMQSIAQPTGYFGLFSYNIASWLDNKKAAAAVTFDDALNNQFDYAMPALNARDISATFFVVANSGSYPVDWTKVQNARANGHEIGAHGMTHMNLNNTVHNYSVFFEETFSAKTVIESHLPGYRVTTHAWASGGSNVSVRNTCSQYFIGARSASVGNTCYENYAPWTKENYPLRIGAKQMNSAVTFDNLTNCTTSAINANGWMVLMFHAIETGGYANVSISTFNIFMDVLVNNKNQLWIAPFGDQSKYFQQRQNASLSVYYDNSQSVAFNYSLAFPHMYHAPVEWFDYPVTINIRKIPGTNYSAATQNGKSLSIVNHTDSISINIVPNAGAVVLTKQSVGIVDKMDDKNNIECFAFENVLTIKSLQTFGGKLQIFALDGRQVFSKKLSNSNLYEFQLNLPPQLYLVKLTGTQFNFSAKVFVGRK